MRIAEFQNLAADASAPERPVTLPEADKFITYKDLPGCGIPQWSRVHMRRLMSKGLFPRPVMLSPNRVAWRLSDLNAWKTCRPVAPSVEEAA
jgi:predicted DNA-binding transcriptional regulator AlpA